MTFTANGEHLVGGGYEDVQVWRVKDGKRVATMKVEDGVWSVIVSKDGRFIAAGSNSDVFVWDATIYKQIFVSHVQCKWMALGRQFPAGLDSTRLVSANGDQETAMIWDIPACRKVRTLDHGESAVAAKYSPQGDRIATASEKSIKVRNSEDGRLLVNVK